MPRSSKFRGQRPPVPGRCPVLTLYLAGPMTGLPDFNRPAFHEAAAKLRAAGAVVLSPAETPEPVTAPEWADWMRAGIRALLDADGLALLPRAAGSRGAALECRIAHELAVPVLTVPGWLTRMGQEDYMRRLTGRRGIGRDGVQ